MEHLETADTLARLGGDRDLLRELYHAFALDAPLKLQTLRHALDDARRDDAARQAHALKGAAAAIGAEPCRQLALELETLLKTPTHATPAPDAEKRATELVHAIHEEMRCLLELIQPKDAPA